MPCQTMSWSETELLRHIHHVTQISENQDFVPITISLDFVKWNNRWRHDAVAPIFKNIDDLLGQPLLHTYSHEFFQNSYFYLSSHLNPPDYLKLSAASTSKSKPIDPKLSFKESKTTWIGLGWWLRRFKTERMDNNHKWKFISSRINFRDKRYNNWSRR